MEFNAVVAPQDGVVKARPPVEILGGVPVVAFHAARFPDAQDGAGLRQRRVLEARNVLLQEPEDAPVLPAAFHDGVGNGLRVQALQARIPACVDQHLVPDGRIHEMHAVAQLQHVLLPVADIRVLQRAPDAFVKAAHLDELWIVGKGVLPQHLGVEEIRFVSPPVPVGNLVRMLLQVVEGLCQVHPGDPAQHVGRRADSVAVLAVFKLRARVGTQVPISAGVNEHLRGNHAAAALVFHDYAADRVPFLHRAHHQRAVQDPCPRFGQHVLRQQLAGFRVHGHLHHFRRRPGCREGFVGNRHLFLPQPHQEFGGDAGHERLDGNFRHQARGHDAADHVFAFNQQGFRAAPGRVQGCCEAGGSAARHDDVIALRDGGFQHFTVCSHILSPLSFIPSPRRPSARR